jgi:cytochrome c556
MSSQPKSPSPASRYLFMALLGLAIGVIATVMLARTLQARRDPFPDSLMQVMAKQTELLSTSRTRNRCTASDTLPRLQSLRALSNDLETAFPSLKDDRRFIQHAGNLRASLDQALANVPADCVALQSINDRIGEACKACHQDFR